MALRLIDYGSTAYDQMVELRYQILRKPLGLFFYMDDLKDEAHDLLIGCFDENVLEGCCILTPVDESTIKLRQMAVITGLQNKGIGKAIIHFAENIARDRRYTHIIMNAREAAIPFYEKLGYEICSDFFEEVTIPHVQMKKEL